MAKYRCIAHLSMCNRPDLEINRSFAIGDEIVSSHPLDEILVGRTGPRFVRMKGSEDAVEPEQKPLEKMSVNELRELAAEMGYPDLPQNLKKQDIVDFLRDLK